MKFAFSIFAATSLFAGAFAAPALPVKADIAVAAAGQQIHKDVSLPSTPNTKRVDLPSAGCVQVQTILTKTITQVKEHTLVINKTVSALPVGGVLSNVEKTSLVQTVKTELYAIVSIVQGAVTEVQGLSIVQGVEGDLTEVVALITELITEIVFTLKGVLALVGGTVFGVVLPLLVNILAALLIAIEGVLGGVLALVQQLLAPILALVGQVLSGLIEIVANDCGCLSL